MIRMYFIQATKSYLKKEGFKKDQIFYYGHNGEFKFDTELFFRWVREVRRLRKKKAMIEYGSKTINKIGNSYSMGITYTRSTKVEK